MPVSISYSRLVDSVLFAEVFTTAVLGALQNANVILSKDGQHALVQLISSVIDQEGEQNGYYRYFLKRIPSEKPFLTYVPASFAFSVLRAVVVPGSCAFEISRINLPIFPPLFPNNPPVPVDVPKPEHQTITFSGDLSNIPIANKFIGGSGKGLFLTYTTGQQLPVFVPIDNVQFNGNPITFQAEFPYIKYAMAAFSHAALTTTDQFSSADTVVESTLGRPVLLQVNNLL